jgi:hypothetical protein
MKALSIFMLTCLFFFSATGIKAQIDSTAERSDTTISASDTSNDENERVMYFDMVGAGRLHKSLLLYNNPNKLPKFWLSTNLFSMWGWFYGPYFPVSLNAYYRTGNPSYVQLYDVQGNFKGDEMRFYATYNYKIFNKLKHRTVYQLIPGGDGNNYSADIPINHYRSLDIGIGPAFDKQR